MRIALTKEVQTGSLKNISYAAVEERKLQYGDFAFELSGGEHEGSWASSTVLFGLIFTDSGLCNSYPTGPVVACLGGIMVSSLLIIFTVSLTLFMSF